MWVRRTSPEIAEIERVKQRKCLSPIGAFVITTFLFFVVWLGDYNTSREFKITSPAFVVADSIAVMRAACSAAEDSSMARCTCDST